MRTLGNIAWMLLFGCGLAPAYLVAGLLLLLTIIGIPFGIASIKMALGTRVVDAAAAAWDVPRYRREPVPAQR